MEGVLPDMEALLDMGKKHQATREPWEMSLHEELPSLDCSSHHLPSRLTFRAHNNPILQTEFLHILEENLDIGDLCPFLLSFAE